MASTRESKEEIPRIKSIKDFEIDPKRTLLAGPFSDVSVARYVHTNEVYCVRRFHPEVPEKLLSAYFERLKKCNQAMPSYPIPCLGRDSTSAIFPGTFQGTLADFLVYRQNAKVFLTPAELLSNIKHLLHCVWVRHRNEIYGGICQENILIYRNSHNQIALMLGDVSDKSLEINPQNLNSASDILDMGEIIAFLIVSHLGEGQHTFESLLHKLQEESSLASISIDLLKIISGYAQRPDARQLRAMLNSEIIQTRFSDTSEQLLTLVSEMLADDPKARPSAEVITLKLEKFKVNPANPSFYLEPSVTDEEFVPHFGDQLVDWSLHGGIREAQFQLAVILREKGHTVQAVKWFRAAAEQGYARAQFFLGQCLERGEGSYYPDPKQAEEWYHKAAENKNPAAISLLAKRKEAGTDRQKETEREHLLPVWSFLGARKNSTEAAQDIPAPQVLTV